VSLQQRLCALSGRSCPADSPERPAARVGGTFDGRQRPLFGVRANLLGTQRNTAEERSFELVLLAVEQFLQVVGAHLRAIRLLLAQVAPRLPIEQLGLAVREARSAAQVGWIGAQPLIVEIGLRTIDRALLAVDDELLAIGDALIQIADRLLLVELLLVLEFPAGFTIGVHERGCGFAGARISSIGDGLAM
jgi:hypothetical protein